MGKYRLSYLNLYTTDPAWNLAVEEYVFDYLPRDRAYCMLWQNDNSVIIGRYQNTLAEINEAYVRNNGVRVVRRLSGGGAVYHDMGNLNFTFIADTEEIDTLDFKFFCQPIVRVLNHFGVTAEITGRNDITIAGQKFSGNSQYLREGRVMHHGTIMFDSDLKRVSQVLHVDPEKVTSKGISSVRSRVTSVLPHMSQPISLEEFRKELLQQILQGKACDEYVLSEDDLCNIQKIKEQRYATWEWNYGLSHECQKIKKKRFPAAGSVEVSLSMDNGIIRDVYFCGDFFSVLGIDVLREKLLGVRMEEESIRSALEGLHAQHYIVGMTNEDLIDLILS